MKLSNQTIKRLQEHFIMDISKPEVPVVDRAIMLRDYLKEKNLSQRKFAEKFEIANSTVFKWLLPLNMNKKQLAEIKDETKITEVYKALGKHYNDEDNYHKDESLNEAIEFCLRKIKNNMNNKIVDEIKLRDDIIKLKNLLGEILNKI